MAVPDQLTRQYWLICRRCHWVWETDCQVRTLHDEAGDHDLFYVDGRPAPAPWAAACPRCGGLRVELLPGPLTPRAASGDLA
jgi:hypothetical protein